MKNITEQYIDNSILNQEITEDWIIQQGFCKSREQKFKQIEYEYYCNRRVDYNFHIIWKKQSINGVYTTLYGFNLHTRQSKEIKKKIFNEAGERQYITIGELKQLCEFLNLI